MQACSVTLVTCNSMNYCSFSMYCVTIDKPDAIASELVGAKLIDAKNIVAGNENV